jgi:Fe-S cluster biogenesis protein NfuA
MFVQTEVTPNPNSLKFLPGKKVSNSGPYEITNKDETQNALVRNLLSINGVEGIFLGEDFISINKKEIIKWDEIKHIVISFINDFYSEGKEFVIDESLEEQNSNLDDLEQKIVKILDEKIRPAVARDGGDIKFKEFKDGVVKVQLQGSCSGCPSSTMTLKARSSKPIMSLFT